MRRWITFLATVALAAVPLGAQKAKWVMPRTPDGHPDMQGIWTNVTLTKLERPAELGGKLDLTPKEAEDYEKKDRAQTIDGDVNSALLQSAGSAGTGAYNDLFIDRGKELATVRGMKRSSLIIDPPDGKIPPILPAARERNATYMRNFNRFDSVKQRPLSERCMIGFGSTSGPPMLPVLYNNNYQIVQTIDTVVILVEMVHDARIVRMNGQHAPEGVRQYLGDSVGHWEGDTLVVDTTNFTEETRFRGSSKDLHVVERFTQADANTLLYRATIEDKTTFTKPWTIEYPFVASNEPIFEYACHEGNYSIEDILGGARKTEASQSKQ